MRQFEKGDRVRIDITDTTDPDHEEYHGEHGTIVDVLEDDAEMVSEDRRERTIFRVRLKDGGVMDFRWRDLRPPIE